MLIDRTEVLTVDGKQHSPAQWFGPISPGGEHAGRRKVWFRNLCLWPSRWLKQANQQKREAKTSNHGIHVPIILPAEMKEAK